MVDHSAKWTAAFCDFQQNHKMVFQSLTVSPSPAQGGSTRSVLLPCIADTGGRTVQALPRETQVTGQDWRTKNYKLDRENVIIYLPYIG